MSRVIVTGGAGRLGRSVVAELATAGHEVISIDLARSGALDSIAEQVEVDLLDAGATAGQFARIKPDAVVHLAAIAVPHELPDAETFRINTGLAWSVLDAALATTVDRLLFASSPTVIGYGSPDGWQPRYLPLDEAHPVAPWNGYALSKVAIEGLVDMAVRRDGHRARFGSFRACYVIAPEEWAGAPTQSGHTVEERLAEPALAAVSLFNYVDARDAGEFVTAWIESAHAIPNGSTFFVGAEDSLVRGSLPEAIARYVPDAAEHARGLASDAPVFSSRRAAELLHWRARRRWRTELSTLQEERVG